MTALEHAGAAALAACALLAAAPAAPAAAQDPGLRIVVLDGDDNINIIEGGAAVPTRVEVRDRDGRPVSGATVLFLLGEGATATLNAGQRQVTLETNAQGQAAVAVVPVASGGVELSVSAAFGGETATLTVVQSNYATVEEAVAAGVSAPGAPGTGTGTGGGTAPGGGPGRGALVGIAAAAGAAVGTGLAVGGGEDPSPPPPPPASTPSAPPAPQLTPGDGRLDVSWSPPASDGGAAIDDYDVRYRPSGGAWQALPDGAKSTATTAAITGLTNGMSYEVQVRAGNSAGDGPWSAGATAVPVGPASPERAALMELYDATGGADWRTNTNWGSDAPLDEWFGVSADQDGRVRQLYLSDNRLTGPMPSSLGDSLTNLTVLQLRDNRLSGPIPSSLGSLIDLTELDLTNNSLSGPIPSSLGGLGNLAYLGLHGNLLTGSIPSSLGDLVSLTTLQLGRNRLTGSIPSVLGGLANLESLHLERNLLTGSIPSSIGNLANLYCLGLNDNQLTGSIPPSLGNLRNLSCLALENNQLTGPIPSALGALTDLIELFLDNNQLSGSIPASLGDLAELLQLGLGSNQLTGAIPPSLGKLTNLHRLNLTENRLTGSIPAALCKFEDSINPQQGSVNLPCEPSSATAQSLAALSVGDARAEEAAGAAVAFAVTLSRAAAGPVTVDYATRDGSARAGEDYTAASGTLTFATGESSKTVEIAVLDDARDEGGETFVLALSNASGARLEDAEATGTIENADLVPAALLARFGRASAEHVVEHVAERMAKPREPGFRARFAGREVGPGMERDFALDLLSQFGRAAGMDPTVVSPVGTLAPGAGIAAPGMAGRDPRTGGAAFLTGHGAAGGVDFAGPVLPGGDLVSGSAFELNRARHGGVLSVWSRSARSSFGGRQGALSLNGDVRTTMLGADYTRGRLVAGLSLARSEGLGGYDGRHPGQLESSATGLYPWLGYRVGDRVSVWGVTGYGTGALRLTPDGAAALESGLSMAMAAAGTRGELVGSRAGGGFALAFKADALWVGTSVDGVDGPAGRLSASDAAVTRIRTGIEGSRGFAIGGRVALTPSVELGVRQDAGDAETGTGVDVGGGLSFTDSLTGLSLDVQVRTLVAHQAEGFTDRGLSLSFGWDPTPSSPRGFAARVAPSWGGDVRGPEALWRGGPLSRFGTHGGQAAGRVDAELGYGLPVGRRFVGTPRVGFGSSAYGRTYRLGYRVGALGVEDLDFELGVDTHRRESPMLDGGDLGVLGRASVRW